MKNLLACILVATTWLIPTESFTLAADAKQSDKPSFADYQVVMDTNIFVRRKPVPKPSSKTENQTPSEVAPPPAPVNKFLLCGIIIENDDRFTAMIEDAQTHTLRSLHIGDKVDVFEIQSMTISSVMLNLPDGRTAELFIGQSIDANGNLLQSGWIPTAKSTSSAPADASDDASSNTSSDAAATKPASEKELSILEKLRRRRESQLNK